MRLAALLALLGAILLPGEIIDRVVATVGQSVVTLSDVALHLRIQQFLNEDPLDLSPSQEKLATQRLIEQALIRREVETAGYSSPDMADVDILLEQLRKERFPTEAEYVNALKTYGITEEQLRLALQWQLVVLRFVEYRFRPGVQVSEADIRNYYERELVPNAKSLKKDPPSLEDSREDIERILTDQRVDQALSHWLGQARERVAVKVFDDAFTTRATPPREGRAPLP